MRAQTLYVKLPLIIRYLCLPVSRNVAILPPSLAPPLFIISFPGVF